MFFVLILFPLMIHAQIEVGATVKCPACPIESCRWAIRAQTEDTVKGKRIVISWDKSIVSSHVEKPFAKPLHCNVDRSFNMEKGGYIKVWFEGESEPCDATKVADPAQCGVEFKFGPQGPSEIFPSGFNVSAPDGKKLKKVVTIQHK